MSRKTADNRKLHFRENMALPGVGVFPGENPEFIVRHLREAGFPVKAVWAQVSSTQVPYCSFLKNSLLFPETIKFLSLTGKKSGLSEKCRFFWEIGGMLHEIGDIF